MAPPTAGFGIHFTFLVIDLSGCGDDSLEAGYLPH